MTGEGKTRVQISLTTDMLDRLNEWCNTLGISKSAAAAMALAEWLRKVEVEHGSSSDR